jgi:hypothetical protein
LRGGNGGPKAVLEAAAEKLVEPIEAPPGKRLLQASMVLADLVLLAFVARLIFIANGPMGFIQNALCVLALMTGAWLSCLALWLGAKSRSGIPNPPAPPADAAKIQAPTPNIRSTVAPSPN